MTAVTLPALTVAHLEALAEHMGDRVLNGYRCTTCQRFLITTHVDAGVTPITLACRKTPGCTGTSFSLNYPAGPIPAGLGEPTHEWYRPERDEFDLLDASMQEHVLGGGLLIREVAAL